MSELGDYGVTRDVEDSIRSIARSEVASERPKPRYALVKAVDPNTRRAQVQYNGDTSTVWVPYGSERPAYVDQPVIIEGTDSDRHIAQVIGNTQADVDLSAVASAYPAADAAVRHNMRGQFAMVGGGNKQVSTVGIAWTEAFYLISTGRTAALQAASFYAITMPTSGTVTGVGGAANRSFSSTGINLGDWEALYYLIPYTSSATATVTANFRVASYTAEYELPDNAVLVAIRFGGTDKSVRWGDGTILKTNEHFDPPVADAYLASTTGLLAANAETFAQSGWTASKNVSSTFKSSSDSGTGSGWARFVAPIPGFYELSAQICIGMADYGKMAGFKFTLNGRTATSNTIAFDHRKETPNAFGGTGAHVILRVHQPYQLSAGDIIYWTTWGEVQYDIKNIALGGARTRVSCRWVRP